MLSHIVLFSLKETSQVEETAAILRTMEGKIPTLKGLEVGVDCIPSARSAHLALITRFDDEAGLEAYQVHPVHQGVLAHMKTVLDHAIKVDFES